VFKSGDLAHNIEGSLRTQKHDGRLQMLNLHWRPADPHIDLDMVIGGAGAIVSLLELAPDREVNNTVLLIDHHGIAGRDEL
jgi:hypothetical protein